MAYTSRRDTYFYVLMFETETVVLKSSILLKSDRLRIEIFIFDQ